MNAHAWLVVGVALLWLVAWAFLRVRAWVRDVDIRISRAEENAKYAYDRAWKAINELSDLRDHLGLRYSEPGRPRLVKRS